MSSYKSSGACIHMHKEQCVGGCSCWCPHKNWWCVMGTPSLYNCHIEMTHLCCCSAGWDSPFSIKVYGKSSFPSRDGEGSPFHFWFSVSTMFMYSPGEAFVLQANKTKKNTAIERQWWGDEEKREQLTLLPSPFLCASSTPILSASVFDVTHGETNQRSWTSLFFFLSSSPPTVPYISPTTTFSRVYNVLPESQ